MYASGEKPKNLYQSYAREVNVLIQEEICNFMIQLMYFMHDGYLTGFSSLVHRLNDFGLSK